MLFQTGILLIVLAVFLECATPSRFDEFVEYVNKYINFTANYEIPKNNSYMYVTDQNSTITDDVKYDFIIIGGGSAGTVLARRLSEEEKFKVLLLEAGGLGDAFVDIPAMGGYTVSSPFNWGYKTTPQKQGCAGMVNQQCNYPRGKGLGGSHLINSMMYIRGSKADYDDWSGQGNKGWAYDQILKYFKKFEHDDTNNPKHTSKYHSVNGLLHTNYTLPLYLNYDKFVKGFQQSGLRQVDVNGESQIGVENITWTIKDNIRQTGGNAYVQPVLKRKNLKVVLGAFVTDLIIDGNIAKGAKYVKDKKIHSALATKEVLLCAGSINSPQILMLNGIGPKDELKKHNIKVKSDLPVGKYLTDHPAYLGVYIRTNNTAPDLTFTQYLKRYVADQNPLVSCFGGQHVAFINTKVPGQDPPNIQLITSNPPFSVSPQNFLNIDDVSYSPFKDYNPLTDHSVFSIVIKPKSRGSVRLQSNSPEHFPLIDPAFYTDPGNEDIQTMYEGVQFILNLVKTPALRSVNATVITESPRCEHLKAVSEKEYWYCAIKDVTFSIFHPSCTTRMGVSPNNSVVDHAFRVHNMKKLRVCDAGSMPNITRGNLLAPVMMMAEKLSDMLKQEYA